MDPSLTLSPADYGLLTDLYELTMAACYVGEGIHQQPASFEVFVRQLPEGFGYLVAAGLDQVLDYLTHFHFSAERLQQLQDTGIFDHAPEQFWSLLRQAEFTGDLWAVPEGTAVFGHEPLLRVDAPLWQAQIVETYLLNSINYQTLVATRAAQMRDVAGERATLLEFGSRRAFSPQASIWAARAAIAGGMDATSNVLAALKLGEKPSGTMAHALVMAISALRNSEDAAFTAFLKYFPDSALLIDTYDTLEAVDRLVERAKAGMEIKAVRLDSGDLVALSQAVRSRLPGVAIVASGDLDAPEIARLRQAGAEIDGYGVGTKLVTGQPVNGVYKLVEIGGIPVMKGSAGKKMWPGRKQVFRRVDERGQLQGDRLGLMEEAAEPGETPLLKRVMQAGQRLHAEPLSQISERTRQTLRSLPDVVRRAHSPGFSPRISDALQAVEQRTQSRISSRYTEAKHANSGHTDSRHTDSKPVS
ncbi:MAG: nicotinate phosphoribosyltransferase [Elainellaceae cyanobacterium]